MTKSVTADEPLTIAGFQQVIRDRYHATDAARGIPATWMWFSEEFGELARALARDKGDEASRQAVRQEFADVVAWLCTLANVSGVDLESAIRDKYLGDAPPVGAK